MDKLVAFFKNVWFRRVVALLCWGYTALMLWVAWLNFGFYFVFENPTPLFVLYLFVNIAALGLMIYTRKQMFTKINAYILPPIVFAIVIFGFGNWYMIAPPLVVMLVVFFVNNSNETLKTVLGTMYLLMYVIGVVGYIGIKMFMGDLSFTGVDLSRRDLGYEKLSKSGDYRIVRYINDNSERKTMSYYVEYTGDDTEIPLGLCKKVFGCKHVHTATYKSTSEDLVSWSTQKVDGETVDVLLVEGSLRENPYLIKPAEEGESSSSSSKSLISSRNSDSSDSASTDESGTSDTAATGGTGEASETGATGATGAAGATGATGATGEATHAEY